MSNSFKGVFFGEVVLVYASGRRLLLRDDAFIHFVYCVLIVGAVLIIDFKSGDLEELSMET